SVGLDGGAGLAFSLNPTFFGADFVNDSHTVSLPVNQFSIRVQSTGSPLNEADALFITVANARILGNQVGQSVPVGPATNVRASLYLHRSCPQQPVQLELDGAIIFTKLGSASADGGVPVNFNIQFGDELAAAFSFDVVDRRAITFGTQPQASGHIVGD